MGETQTHDHLHALDGHEHMSPEAMAEAVEQAKAEHRALEARLNALNAARYLTPEEDAEVHRLKKVKLHKKDEIARLANLLAAAPHED
jgi:hypothetical protein